MAVGVSFDVEYWGGPFDGLRQVFVDVMPLCPLQVPAVVVPVDGADLGDPDATFWRIHVPGRYLARDPVVVRADGRVEVWFDWHQTDPIEHLP